MGQYDTYDFKSPVQYNVTITNTGNAFLVSGSANAKAQTSCSRCLKDIDVELEAKIDAFYMIEPPAGSEDEINEFEILPVDHNIDLGEIIKATMLVDAPLKPVCTEDCKGLCLHCGKNLNDGPCSCDNKIVDETSPFSVLKDFKFQQ